MINVIAVRKVSPGHPPLVALHDLNREKANDDRQQVA